MPTKTCAVCCSRSVWRPTPSWRSQTANCSRAIAKKGSDRPRRIRAPCFITRSNIALPSLNSTGHPLVDPMDDERAKKRKCRPSQPSQDKADHVRPGDGQALPERLEVVHPRRSIPAARPRVIRDLLRTVDKAQKHNQHGHKKEQARSVLHCTLEGALEQRREVFQLSAFGTTAASCI